MIIIDTSENVDTEKLVQKINAHENGIAFLSDRIIVSSSLLIEDKSISLEGIPEGAIDNKQELLSLLDESNMIYIYILIFETILIYFFIIYLASNFVDVIVLGALGYIFARIVRLRLRFKATFNIGIHAISLPILLNTAYIIVNTFTGFKINHFQWMYTSISYIYVAVAILMIKTEIINQKIQLMQLKRIQENLEETQDEEIGDKEDKEEKEEKQDKEKEENKKDDIGNEQPEGNNA